MLKPTVPLLSCPTEVPMLPRSSVLRGLVERVGEAGARRDIVPGERRFVAGEADAGDDVGEGAVALGRARQRLAALAVVTKAEVERQPVAAEGVADIEAEVLGPVGACALAIEAGHAAGRRLDPSLDLVTRPDRLRERIRPPPADAVLEVVRAAERGLEPVAVHVDDVLRPQEEAAARRPASSCCSRRRGWSDRRGRPAARARSRCRSRHTSPTGRRTA